MKQLIILACSLFLWPESLYVQTIKVNQLGYLPHHSKYAWVNNLMGESVKWRVKEAGSGRIVYEGESRTAVRMDSACGEKVTRLDFSALDKEGQYFVEVDGAGISPVFPVSRKAYEEAWKASVKSYYYQRSGMDLAPEYAGIWNRKATHTRDAILYKGFSGGKILEGEYRNCRGGWYDAGDFGKKIVPASIALYAFLKLAALHPEQIKQASIAIPNPWHGLPAMLAEVKWELDWFFTMQDENGAVHHLLVSPDFFIGPAQDDTFPRYVLGVSSTATADYAATMALAGTVFKSYLPSYADSCLQAAEKAWTYLAQNPDIFPAGGYHDPEGIHATGGYDDPRDRDERLWASAELFNATGKKEYLSYFEVNQARFRLDHYSWWQDPHNYAFFSYLLSNQPGRNPECIRKIGNRVRQYAEKIKTRVDTAAYGVALLPEDYVWGSNSYALNYGMDLLLMDEIFGTREFEEAALQQLHYILGCNTPGICFVSNFGSHPVKDPHQSINSYDTLSLAPPGFIPGGPNRYPQDPILANLISARHPAPAACYVDQHWAYACNEVCTTFTSGFVFLAGYFCNTDTPSGKGLKKQKQSGN